MVERATPSPGPGQVRVRVDAVALNYRDLLMLEGRYNPRQALPLIPVSDGVGRVDAVGPGVLDIPIGTRVVGCFSQRWVEGKPDRAALSSTLGGPRDGMLAQYAILEAEGVVVPPVSASDHEAATYPCAGVTAWSAVIESVALPPGATVVVQGSGGVSIYALQFARLAGLRTIVVTGSPGKAERLAALGADHVVVSRHDERWDKEVRALTGGVGADLVVEVGGVATLDRSIRVTRPGGTIALIGVLAGYTAQLDLTPAIMQGIRIQGVFVGSRGSLVRMMTAIERTGMSPKIDAVHAFEDAPAAFEHLASGKQFGKIVVRVTPP